MRITVLPAARLTPAQCEAWARLQEADAALASPYFRPEFTLAVAAVRADVEVAVLEDDGAPVGFFPFQRARWNVGKPVGGRMSDFQGVVARPGLELTADELIRGCGLRGWDFDHVLAAQPLFRPYHAVTAGSPYLDLSRGFEAYKAARASAGSEKLRRVLSKARKIEREVGPLRFESHTTDPRAFAALIDWKCAQYRRTAATNVFGFPWTVALLERVLLETGEAFAGRLSALYVGDQLVAVEYGMRSHAVHHAWFPAYNVEFAKYSPGLILMVELAKAAQRLGIERMDLGKGDTQYKTCFMSGAIPLAEGCVAPHPLLRVLRRGWRHTRAWIRSGPLRLAGRWTRPLRGWLAFR
jgi:CelD/BcsL family acetyltransferase involved in cellulose biosynthesis